MTHRRHDQAALTERERILHLLNRATFGARPEDVAEVARLGRAGWLDAQLTPATVADPVVSARTAPPPSTALVLAPPAAATAMTPPAMMVEVEPIEVVAGKSLAELVAMKIDRALYTERQLEEVMTGFWLDHFNVDQARLQVRVTLPDYEQRAIRANVFGRFEDMLAATANSVAMLVYLDNAVSTAPKPGANGQTIGGLNENYARELLELHTLGVDGGYTQRDVVEVARAFTGWGTAGRPSPNTVFQYDDSRHDQGDKLVLGQRIAGGRGQAEGLELLRLLARHPSTAEHIASKLVERFAADRGDAQLVADLARVFRDTDGDLREVTRALFLAEAFYAPASYRAKVKRPFEFMASALRACGVALPTGRQSRSSTFVLTQLQLFRHVPYAQPAPTGYPTTADHWVSSGAMLERLNFALSMVGGGLGNPQVHASSTFQDAMVRFGAGDDGAGVRSVLNRVLPGVSATDLASLIEADLAANRDALPDGKLRRAVALAVGSPEFQRC
jgi:uncharacterized protein (DUF1800 family)